VEEKADCAAAVIPGSEQTVMLGRLLIVDDVLFSANYLRQALMQQRLGAVAVPTASQARAALGAQRADLVLLDVTLPDASGYDMATWLRATYADVGIIFISGHAGTADRLRAFEAGADDFLAKPVLMAELVARVRAVLRRRGAQPPSAVIEAGGVRLDRDRRTLTLPDGRAVALEPAETQIMALLLARPGQLFLQADLARALAGERAVPPTALLRALATHLDALRAKIEPDPLWARYVQVIHNVGARFILPRR
jgi:DNA-binding response OmpR family regulator